MSTFHLSLIKVSVVSTGQAGSSLTAAITIPSRNQQFPFGMYSLILLYCKRPCQGPPGSRLGLV